MIPALRRASRPWVVLAAGIAVLLAIHAWYWWTHRRGFTVFVDEAGYGVFSLDFTQALRDDGLGGLWRAFHDQRFYAPLVPLLGVPFHLIAGNSLTGTYVVVLASTGVLAVATYLVAVRFSPPAWAVGAALVTMCAPDVLVWSRAVLFAVPAAAFFVTAVACLQRSRGFLDVRWAAAGGALLGLAALSRTMMLGLVPAPVVAVAIHAIAVGGHTRRRVVGGIVCVATGVAIAATWYSEQLSEVVSYLRENPFHKNPHARLDRPPLRDIGQLFEAVQLPLALALVGGIVALTVHEVRRRRSSERGPATPWIERARHVLAREWAVVALCVAQGFVVLRIAREATGQLVPLLPLIISLLLAGFARLPVRARRVTAAALAAASIFNLAAQSDVIDGLGARRQVTVALLGRLELIEGRQFVERQLDDQGWPTGRATRLPDVYRRWPVFNDRVVRAVVEHAAGHGVPPVLFLVGGAQDPLNTNTLLLADRVAGSAHDLLVGELPAREGSADELRRRLTDPKFGYPRYVLAPDRDKTVDGRRGDPTPRHVARTLREAGFEVIDEIGAPDGRTFALWWRVQ